MERADRHARSQRQVNEYAETQEQIGNKQSKEVADSSAIVHHGVVGNIKESTPLIFVKAYITFCLPSTIEQTEDLSMEVSSGQGRERGQTWSRL